MENVETVLQGSNGIQTSAEVDQLYSGLVGFQAEVTNLLKTKAGYGNRYRFTPLDVIINEIRPILDNHGLGITSAPTNAYYDPDFMYNAKYNKGGVHMEGSGIKGCYMVNMVTRIIHKSGQWQETISPMPIDLSNQGMSVSQAMGVAHTYARRYGINAALNIVTDEDTDGRTEKEDATEVSASKSPITLKTYESVMSIASKVYAGETEEMLPNLISWVSDKRTDKYKDIFEDEGIRLIKALNKKLEPAKEPTKE